MTSFSLFILASVVLASSKLDAMRKMQAKSDTGLIRMTDADYKTYVLEQPRPYTVFVLLTGPFSQLQVFEDAFAGAAQVYKSSGEEFFVMIDAHAYRNILQIHAIADLPVIAHVGPEMWRTSSTNETTFSKETLFPPVRDVSADKILRWVNYFTGKNLRSKSDAWMELALVGWIVACVVAIVAMVIVAVRQNPMMMIVGAFGIHFISVSGFFSNLLDRDGIQWGPSNRAFFMPGSRGQYLREAIVVGFCTFVPSLSLIALVNSHRFIEGWTLKSGHTTHIALLTLAFIASQLLIMFFFVKTRWYSEPPFFPFSKMKTGGIYVDQGNTIL